MINNIKYEIQSGHIGEFTERREWIGKCDDILTFFHFQWSDSQPYRPERFTVRLLRWESSTVTNFKHSEKPISAPQSLKRHMEVVECE
jgi:hypothetical protein